MSDRASRGFDNFLVRWIATAIANSVRRLAIAVHVVEEEQAARALEAALSAPMPFAPVIYYWQRDVLLLLVLGISSSQLRPLLRRVEYICDDSFGGRVTAELLRRLGGYPRLIHRAWSVDRLRDLRRMLRSRTPIGIAIDGHGPYGVVREEVGRLFSGARAVAVPIAAAATRTIPMYVRAIMLLPRRQARIAVSVGAPVDLTCTRRESSGQMELALRRTTQAARLQIGVSMMSRAVPKSA